MKKLLTAVFAGILAISVVPASAKSTHYLPVKETGYYTNVEGTMKKAYVTENKYTGKGVLKTYKTTGFQDNGKKIYTLKGTYTIKNNKQLSLISKDKYIGGSEKTKEVYKYKKNDLVKKISYYYNTDKKKFKKSSYETYKRTSKKVVTKIYYGGKLTHKVVDILAKNGQIKKSKEYDGTGKLFRTTKNTYNKKGYLIKSVSKGNLPGAGSTTKYKYTYDKHGNIKTQIIFYDGQKFSKTVYKYKKFSY